MASLRPRQMNRGVVLNDPAEQGLGLLQRLTGGDVLGFASELAEVKVDV